MPARKEHDALYRCVDYFGARYYSSVLGRFLTPDWSATPVPAPYASLGSPQTLNLYGYVQNNPITGTDPDGHLDIGLALGAGLAGDPDIFMADLMNNAAKQAKQDLIDAQFAANNAANLAANNGHTGVGSGSLMKTQNQAGDKAAPKPAPTDPQTGKPTPPPVPVPGAPEGTGWVWNPNEQNPRGGTWGPDKWKGPNPPNGSWDPDGHWDVNRGKGQPVDHYDPKGNPITPGEAHPGNIRLPSSKQIMIGVGALGAGYLIYRGVRMLPSVVFPPLWPTIPLNAAIP
jgi:RHS repeat-associated core domain